MFQTSDPGSLAELLRGLENPFFNKMGFNVFGHFIKRLATSPPRSMESSGIITRKGNCEPSLMAAIIWIYFVCLRVSVAKE